MAVVALPRSAPASPDAGDDPRRDAERKRRLRALDACLETLEQAHLAGQTHVTGTVYGALRGYVPALVHGERIDEAIERVFEEQEQFMLPDTDTGTTTSGIPCRRPPRDVREILLAVNNDRQRSAECSADDLVEEYVLSSTRPHLKSA